MDQLFLHILATGQKFENRSVVLDNMRFEKCEFSNCDLFYSGGPVEMHSCVVKAGNTWRIQGAAALTLEALRAFGFQISEPH